MRDPGKRAVRGAAGARYATSMIRLPDPSPDTGDRAAHQRLRLIRTGYALAGGVLISLVFALLYQRGAVPLDLADFGLFMGVVWAGNLFFPAFIASGANLRLKDPSMTLAMMLWATTVSFAMVFLALEDRHLLLMVYLLTMVFGTFRLTTGPFLIVAVYALALYALCIVHLEASHPEHFRPAQALADWLVFFVVIGGFTLLGSELSRIRRRLQRRNRELAEARDEATRAGLAKSRFLASTSDELRTPLNMILGVSDVVGSAELTREQRDALDRAHNAGTWLLSMVNSMIDHARLESGALELGRDTFEIAAELHALEDMVAPLAEERGLGFALELDPALAPRVVGDAARLREVLVHLIAIAGSYAGRGEVSLRVTPGSGHRILFAIRDGGDRLPRGRVPGRLGESETDDGTGTGVSVTLCEQLIERMGGTLAIDHGQAGGSRFHFALPLPAAAEPGPPAPAPRPDAPAADATSPRVLIVDDAEDNRLLIRTFLKAEAAVLDMAGDGVEALERFRRDAYDLVLMDMHMPRMDGIQATRAIRELEDAEQRARTVILALTADDTVHDRERSLAAGCDDHLVKPISKKALIAALRAWCARPGAGGAGADVAASPVSAGAGRSARR